MAVKLFDSELKVMQILWEFGKQQRSGSQKS